MYGGMLESTEGKVVKILVLITNNTECNDNNIDKRQM